MGFGNNSRDGLGENSKKPVVQKTLEQKLNESGIKTVKLEGENVGSGTIESVGMSRVEAEDLFVKKARSYRVTNVDEISYSEIKSGLGVRHKVAGRGYAYVSAPKPAA